MLGSEVSFGIKPTFHAQILGKCTGDAIMLILSTEQNYEIYPVLLKRVYTFQVIFIVYLHYISKVERKALELQKKTQ